MKQPAPKPNATQNLPAPVKPRNCSHWADQLQKLFPQTAIPVTPEFISAMTTLMEGYSEAVLAQVCGVNGVVTELGFLPSVAQLKAVLELAAKPERMIEHNKKLGEETLDYRLDQDRIDETRKTNPTYEELVATIPPHMRLHKAPGHDRMTKEQFLKKFPHVTPEQLDACPDASPASQSPDAKLLAPDVEVERHAPQNDHALRPIKYVIHSGPVDEHPASPALKCPDHDPNPFE